MPWASGSTVCFPVGPPPCLRDPAEEGHEQPSQGEQPGNPHRRRDVYGHGRQVSLGLVPNNRPHLGRNQAIHVENAPAGKIGDSAYIIHGNDCIRVGIFGKPLTQCDVNVKYLATVLSKHVSPLGQLPGAP